ncbi:hypothetical protein BH10PAT3_BH10PAT3_6680 [soil metagenome]
MASPDLYDGALHYMQTAAWAEVKSDFGWKADYLTLNNSSVIAYKRGIPGVGKLIYVPGLSTANIPETAKFTAGLMDNYMKRAFGVRLEFNHAYDEQLLKDLMKKGWKMCPSHVQYRHTVVVDLNQTEEDMWMNFKSRGRYEVLQAQKFGVKIEEAAPIEENLQKMYELMQITSSRNKFFIRDSKFTFAYWRKFSSLGQLKLFFALHDGDTLAGAVVLTSGRASWYKDGGSVRVKSNMMAPRLMQWEIMKLLKADGITTYDLGGIPAPESHKNSSMHGIYVFKTAFSKDTISLMPTLELPLGTRYGLWPRAEKQWLRVYNLFAHNLWW